MPGRPILYGTTDEFLRQFDLRDLKDLPSLDLFGQDETEEITSVEIENSDEYDEIYEEIKNENLEDLD